MNCINLKYTFIVFYQIHTAVKCKPLSRYRHYHYSETFPRDPFQCIPPPTSRDKHCPYFLPPQISFASSRISFEFK